MRERGLLARMVKIDPSQIAGLGPTIDHLRQLLLERKRKILETYETKTVQTEAERAFRSGAAETTPPFESIISTPPPKPSWRSQACRSSR